MRKERQPRKPRAPRKPTPPAPLPEGKGEKSAGTPTAESARVAEPTPPTPLPEGKGEKDLDDSNTLNGAQEATSSVTPLPSGRGAGGVGSATRPPVPHLITRQKVDPDKIAFVKQLRDEMTPAERLLWQHLRGNRLGGLHFRRQQLVHGYVADFYCHATGVVVEVDGGIHDTQAEYDVCRDAALALLGLLILRVRNEDVSGDMPGILQHILAACKERLSEVHA